MKKAGNDILQQEKKAVYAYRKAVEVCLLQTAVQVQQESKTAQSYNRIKSKWGKSKRYQVSAQNIGLPRFPRYEEANKVRQQTVKNG